MSASIAEQAVRDQLSAMVAIIVKLRAIQGVPHRKGDALRMGTPPEDISECSSICWVKPA